MWTPVHLTLRFTKRIPLSMSCWLQPKALNNIVDMGYFDDMIATCMLGARTIRKTLTMQNAGPMTGRSLSLSI